MQYPRFLYSLLFLCCANFSVAQCPIPFEIGLQHTTVNLNCGDTLQLRVIAPETDSTLQINWTTNTGNILSGEQTLAPLINAFGVYKVEISTTIGNEVCVDEKQILAESFNREPLNISFPSGINCNQQEVMLEAIDDVNRSEYIYSWTTSLGSIVSDSDMPTITVNSGGVYDLRRTDLMGNCGITIPVVVLDERVLNFNYDFVSPDCEQTEAVISFTTVIGGSGNFSYAIDSGMVFQESPDFFIQEGGDYNLVVRDENNGCLLTKEEAFSFIPIVNQLSLPTEISLKRGATYQLPLSVNLPDSLIEAIQWSPSEGLSCTDCPNPLLTVSQNQTYEVIVRDINGCEAAASIDINIAKSTDTYIPTVFSPNLDGRNDRFTINANTKKVSKIQRFLIFDRYGSLVFENNDFLPNNPAKGWDGRFRGQDMPTGTYAFFAEIELVDGGTRLLNGTITLVR